MRWIAALILAVFLAGPLADQTRILFTDEAAPGQVYAQDEGSASDEGAASHRRTMWDSIKAGGVIGAIIILLSIASLALIIQYTVEQKHDKLIPPHLTAEMEQLFEEQAYDEAADLCAAEDCYFTRIIGAGLAQVEGGYEAIMKSIESTGDEETTKLFQKLSNLNLIAGIAPMLGLFGTVAGMMAAFNIIAATSGGANPAQLADGISQALVTTFLGLVVAIPTSAVYHFLRNRAIKVTLESSALVSSLFERFRAPAA